MKLHRFGITTVGLAAGLVASAQAPMLQDGATALRQAGLDWTLGQAPLPPSSLPSFEVGWGGAGSEGAYAPLTGGEGLGHGVQGWGLGLQGRLTRGGWSFSTTLLALRDHGRTSGVLQRAALAYQWEAGWRAALEQTPFAWGSGLNGGDLLGANARPLPRLSLATPEATLPLGRWRVEAFVGRLERARPLPEWISDRAARATAQAAGLDLQRPLFWGGFLRASFGSLMETSLGAVTLTGGRDAQGQTAPGSAARSSSLAEVRLRLPSLARFVQARGASAYVSRSAAPDNRSLNLVPARDLGGLQLVWDGWDLGLEYAGAVPRKTQEPFTRPAYLAGFSTQGDPLGSAFGLDSITRTVELGLPLFLEGRGRLKVARVSAAPEQSSSSGSWFLQADGQWRTPTGRVGASLASQRDEHLGSGVRWGWTFAVFQAFRVF